ncbi:hypothetical protein D3C78_1176630 [compost metagenome]
MQARAEAGQFQALAAASGPQVQGAELRRIAFDLRRDLPPRVVGGLEPSVVPGVASGLPLEVRAVHERATEPTECHHRQNQCQYPEPASGKVQAILLAEFFQVFGNRKHRFVSAAGGRVEGYGRHCGRAGLLAAGIPPFQFNGWQAVVAFGVDSISHAVDALPAIEIAPTVIQIVDLRSFRVAAQALDIVQCRCRQ